MNLFIFFDPLGSNLGYLLNHLVSVCMQQSLPWSLNLVLQTSNLALDHIIFSDTNITQSTPVKGAHPTLLSYTTKKLGIGKTNKKNLN